MFKILALVIVCALASCAPTPDAAKDDATPKAADSTESAMDDPPAQLLTADGVIVSVLDDAITIEHEGIGDVWEPQTMSFPVVDTSVLEGLAPGVSVRFWVAIRDDESYYIDMIELH